MTPDSAPRFTPGPRLLDFALALIALPLFLLLLPLLALAIVVDDPGPVFFRQQRLGWQGRVFRVFKLRSMVVRAPALFNADGSRLVVGARDPRVTRVGHFLRFGLDELPQVLNIVRGEMSFIGPRPDDAFATQHYSGLQWLKLAARPGITGLAQVTGRNELPWADRMKYDVYYVYHRSLLLDLRIVWRTLTMLMRLDLPPLVPMATVDAFLASPSLARDAAHWQQQVERHRLAQARPSHD